MSTKNRANVRFLLEISCPVDYPAGMTGLENWVHAGRRVSDNVNTCMHKTGS